MEDNKQRLDRFVAWLRDNGAEMDKVEVRESEHGNGVYVKEPIPAEEQYAQIPLRLVVTGRVCREALGADPAAIRLVGRSLLCAFLIQQRFVAGESSFWHPYISILPHEFHTPLFFSDTELELLENTPMIYAVKDRRQLMRDELEEILEQIPESTIPRSVLTTENYAWAAAVVSSRSFTKSLISESQSPDEETSVLLPLLDMMNHRPLTRISWIASDSSIGFAAGTALSKGSEVVNNYGAKSNEELLMGYGFCVPGNPLNSYHIKLNYTMDPLAADKQAILNHAQIASCDHYIRADELPRDLLPTLRVMAMTETDVYYVKRQIAEGHGGALLDDLGLRIELRARFLLAFLLHKKLDALGQKESTLSTVNAQLALQYRTETEGILRSTLSALARAECRLLACASQIFADGLHAHPRYVSDNGQPSQTDAGASSNDEPTGSKKPKQPLAAQQFIDEVLLTEESFTSDPEFMDAVEQIDAEPDVLMTLFVLRIRASPESPWHAAVQRLGLFRHPMLVAEDADAGLAYADMMLEMGEIHDSLFPLLTEHFPKVFPAEQFTPELFLWAAGLVESFRLSVPARCLDAAGDDIEGLLLV
ncbi:hypothetical protein H4S01_000598 [Coemansia sp. RSA 2610]|nr:hypothetical protein H4S01_000598 [Coemansia sp. RSA 2610]